MVAFISSNVDQSRLGAKWGPHPSSLVLEDPIKGATVADGKSLTL